MPTTYFRINHQDIPTSEVSLPSTGNVFREAWASVNEGVIAIDMTKAKDIHRDNLRAERAKEMPVLDAQYMIALEQNNTEDMSNIAALKQVLRGMPADSRIENANTPDELVALTYETLKQYV